MSEKVTAQMVKELRERTGVGMSKCKEALDQTGGDMDAAIDFLRKSGMAQAVKKEGRETKEGSIGVGESREALALVEVNTETDFVASNDQFKTFLQEVAMEAAKTKPADVDSFLKQPLSSDSSMNVEEYRASVVQKLGENIRIKRLTVLPKSSSVSFGIYSHMGGKIVSLVELEGGSGNEELARAIAMHIAAESPDYLSSKDVPQEIKAKEEDIARGQIKNKPENIIEKIVEGKLKAFYDQVCLLNQKYIKDPDTTIEKLVEAEGKKQNKPLKIKRFLRWNIGE